jgi:probable rRNA maturation factor
MITIELLPDSTLQAGLSPAGLTRFLNRIRKAIGLSGEVEVLLADDATLRRLNRSFRGKNKPTDVLSFPSPAEISVLHAGDLAISLETAANQAARYGHSLRDEVRILLLHGLLHLSGFDHETDKGEMAAREAVLRRELRLPTTLIERAAQPLSSKSARFNSAPPSGAASRRLQSAPDAAKRHRKVEKSTSRGVR